MPRRTLHIRVALVTVLCVILCTNTLALALARPSVGTLWPIASLVYTGLVGGVVVAQWIAGNGRKYMINVKVASNR